MHRLLVAVSAMALAVASMPTDWENDYQNEAVQMHRHMYDQNKHGMQPGNLCQPGQPCPRPPFNPPPGHMQPGYNQQRSSGMPNMRPGGQIPMGSILRPQAVMPQPGFGMQTGSNPCPPGQSYQRPQSNPGWPRPQQGAGGMPNMGQGVQRPLFTPAQTQNNMARPQGGFGMQPVGAPGPQGQPRQRSYNPGPPQPQMGQGAQNLPIGSVQPQAGTSQGPSMHRGYGNGQMRPPMGDYDGGYLIEGMGQPQQWEMQDYDGGDMYDMGLEDEAPWGMPDYGGGDMYGDGADEGWDEGW